MPDNNLAQGPSCHLTYFTAIPAASPVAPASRWPLPVPVDCCRKSHSFQHPGPVIQMDSPRALNILVTLGLPLLLLLLLVLLSLSKQCVYAGAPARHQPRQRRAYRIRRQLMTSIRHIEQLQVRDRGSGWQGRSAAQQ